MNRIAFIFAAFMLLTISMPNTVYGAIDALTVDLAEDHVDITTGFHGSRMVLFGTKKSRHGDIAVVVRGPEKKMSVRKKSSVLGAWMNTEFLKFEDIPGFYDFAVSDDIGERVKPDILKTSGVGFFALVFEPKKKSGYSEDEVKNFQQALIRNKQRERLFPEEPKQIKMLNDHFFRTEFYLPANVPKGEYEIETLVFSDGRVSERNVTRLNVKQIGMSASLFRFSKENGFLYGMICVLIAVLAGWGVNTIRRTA